VGGSRGTATNVTVNNGLASSAGLIYTRLLNDGTALHHQFSLDGVYWWDIETIASPASLAYYGFLIGNTSTGGGFCQASIYRNSLAAVSQMTVTGATNASPIVIATSTPHGYMSGDMVAVHGLVGNTGGNSGTSGTNYNSGGWLIKVVDTTHFALISSSGNGTWTSGGVCTLLSR
jgi:hypothetical protein